MPTFQNIIWKNCIKWGQVAVKRCQNFHLGGITPVPACSFMALCMKHFRANGVKEGSGVT